MATSVETTQEQTDSQEQVKENKPKRAQRNKYFTAISQSDNDNMTDAMFIKLEGVFNKIETTPAQTKKIFTGYHKWVEESAERERQEEVNALKARLAELQPS